MLHSQLSAVLVPHVIELCSSLPCDYIWRALGSRSSVTCDKSPVTHASCNSLHAKLFAIEPFLWHGKHTYNIDLLIGHHTNTLYNCSSSRSCSFTQSIYSHLSPMLYFNALCELPISSLQVTHWSILLSSFNDWNFPLYLGGYNKKSVCRQNRYNRTKFGSQSWSSLPFLVSL